MGLKARRLIAALPSWVGGIVTVEETKQRVKTKQEELTCLPNGLAEPLGKSF